MSDRLSHADRLAILAELEHAADGLNQVAVILDQQDAAAAARMLEHAAEQVAACCWVLERPVRRYIPGWVPQAAGNGSQG